MSDAFDMREPIDFTPEPEEETETSHARLQLGSLLAEVIDQGDADGLGFDNPVEASGTYLGEPFVVRLSRTGAETLLQLLEPRLTRGDLREADGSEIAATLVAILAARNGLPAPESVDFSATTGSDLSDARHVSVDLGVEQIDAAVILPSAIAQYLDPLVADADETDWSMDDNETFDDDSEADAGDGLTLRIELARQIVSEAEISDLAEGDLIVPPGLDPARGRAILNGAWAAPCKREGEEYVLEAAPEAFEEAPAEKGKAILIIAAQDELYLDRKIEDCTAGEVLADFYEDASVTLLQGDETVGLGSLVLYDGKPAIRVDLIIEDGDDE